MGIRTKDIKKSSTAWPWLSHTPIILPPGSATFHAAAVARTSIVTGFAFTLAQRASGGSCTLSLVLATATDFTSAFAVSVLLVGRDENHEPIAETVTITGNGTAAQVVTSLQFFSSLDSATVTAVTGNVAGIGTALTFSIGTSDGTSSRIPNPYRGVPAANLNLIAAGGVASIAATSTAPHTTLVVPNTTNQVRLVFCGIFGVDPKSFLET